MDILFIINSRTSKYFFSIPKKCNTYIGTKQFIFLIVIEIFSTIRMYRSIHSKQITEETYVVFADHETSIVKKRNNLQNIS